VAVSGLVLLAVAVVLGARTGFSLESVMRPSPLWTPETLVVILGGVGGLILLVWLRATTAQRIARDGDD
jgi:hypothetical protein